MPELTTEIAPKFVAACRAASSRLAEAFSAALDRKVELTVAEAKTFNTADPILGLDGPGLAILLQVGESGLIGLLPGGSRLLPVWHPNPDTAGASKLHDLAERLAYLLPTESPKITGQRTGWVPDLAETLLKSQPADGAAYVPLMLKSGEDEGTLSLLWPVRNPRGMLDDLVQPQLDSSAADKSAPPPSGSQSLAGPAATESPGDDPFRRLPEYAQSMLRVEVPIQVTLATKKQSINEIVQMGPGAIIKFEKACDEMLDLEVGGCAIAKGEAVKVGDKFGLRINSMILPNERFRKLDRAKSSLE